MNKLKDLLLFFSAFMPMYVLILVKLIVDIIFNNKSWNVLNTINVVTLALLIIFGIWGIVWNVYKSNFNSQEIVIVSITNITDRHFLGYFSLFVLFALQLDLTYVSGYVTYVLILIFIGVVYIKNSLYYINPLLNLLGYSFYDITYKIYNKDNLTNSRIFAKKTLELNKKYLVRIKNENFSFIIKE